MAYSKITRLDMLLTVALFAVALLLRMVNLPRVEVYPDEIAYWMRGVLIMGSEWSWPRELMNDQPPLFPYLTAFVILLWDSGVESARLVSMLAGSVSVPLQYLLGREMFNRRVGVVSALFLAFSGYHILYSRVAYLEVTSVMWGIGALALFWSGVVKNHSLRKAVLGGAFLGLAVDTKYTGLLFLGGLVLWVILTRRDRLLKRENIAFLSAAGAVMLPVLLTLLVNGANPFRWQLFARFEERFRPMQRVYPIDELITRGFDNYASMLSYVTHGTPQMVFPIYSVYYMLWSLMLVAVVLYHVVGFFRKRSADGFLALLFIGIGVFFAGYPTRYQYYLLTSFVVFPTMVGNFVDRGWKEVSSRARGLKRMHKSIDPLHFAGGVLSTVILIMGLTAGVVSASQSVGQFGEIETIHTYLQTTYVQGDYVGTTYKPLDYYIEKWEMNVTSILLAQKELRITTPEEAALRVPLRTEWLFEVSISVETIEQYNPRFILIKRGMFDLFFTTDMRMRIDEQYRRVFDGSEFILFEKRQG